MYRAVKPSRAQVVRAVATCPPASTCTSRMWSFVVGCGKAGTTQIVSIAFRPRPTTSTVLFFKVALLTKSSMALHQSDSIILKTYPLGEADRIVAFFSRDFGKLRGVANGARKMKNRFGASLEPLAHSRLQFFEKENRDLVRIQSADLLDSPMKLFQDYDRAVCAGHLVELVDRFLPEREPQDAVFRLVRMTVRALERDCPI